MKTSQINSTWFADLWENREWFHERIRGKDHLLVTIGDSWTWGDSLGPINIDSDDIWDDYDHRTTNIYGYHLSNLLDCDWVNIAICGASNLPILLEAHKFLTTIEKQYSKVTVVITLTESGRELTSNNILNKEADYNFIKGSSWPSFKEVIAGNNLDIVLNECYESNYTVGYEIDLYHAIKDFKDINDFLIKYEACTFKLVKQLFKTAIVGRNFSNTYDVNKSILGNNLLDKTWVDVIAERGNLEPYPSNLRIMSMMGLTPVLQFAKSLPKEQLIDLIDMASLGIDWLVNSPYNTRVNVGSKHPNEQAHRWWAEYLYQHIR